MAQQQTDTAKESAVKRKSRRKTIDSWKAKSWYEVYAPKTFKEIFLGAIPSATPESVQGRIIETLLYDVTNNFKHITTKLRFRIEKIVGDKCYTRLIGMELTRDFIRSVIHRGTSRIDGIFNYTTADGFIYRVSTFVITRRRAKRSQKHTMRKIIYQVLSEFAKNMPHDRFVRGIIFGKFAVNVNKIAKTIYPLRECQVRKIKCVKMIDGVEDQFFAEDDEKVEDVNLKLREHGKSIKAKKLKRKKEDQKSDDGTSEETPESEEETSKEEEKPAEETKPAEEKKE